MKKFSIKDMSVRAKITTFTAIMLLFMFIIAGVGLFASLRINSARKARYNDYAMTQLYLTEAFNDFANIKVRVRNILFLYYDDTTGLRTKQETEIANYRTRTNEQLALFEGELNKLGSDIRTQFQKVEDSINNWLASMDNQLKMADAGRVDDAIDELMGNGATLSAQAETDMNTLRTMLNNASNEDDKELENELTLLIVAIIVVALVAVLISTVYAAFLIKVIMLPVKKLEAVAESLEKGDVNVDCTRLYDDELGHLMDAFGQMVNNTREQANIANMIAGGDLTVPVTPKGDRDVLGISLQKLVNDNDEILGNVKEATQQVTVGAEQVATASQSLAQGATEQASALEQVTASMDEIAERTKTNASEANKADKLVHNVKEMAVSGNDQMKTMIDAMNDINQSSEMISKIIKVINDISFQTNILALNAAVEAARAGVHGKGFAVVAEQVRELAGKSASAANEITEMIEDSIRKVGVGTKIAEETGKSLDEILSSIDQIVELIATIATASNTQATAVSQVDQALGQVSQVVQTNSATSEQCAAASEELSNQAAALRSLMANYKLSGGSGSNSGFSGRSKSTSSYNSSSDDYNEQIISLNGEFGKY